MIGKIVGTGRGPVNPSTRRMWYGVLFSPLNNLYINIDVNGRIFAQHLPDVDEYLSRLGAEVLNTEIEVPYELVEAGQKFAEAYPRFHAHWETIYHLFHDEKGVRRCTRASA